MPFTKGQSGNPAGRRKEDQSEVKDLARQYTVQAIERLVYWMESGEGRASVAAANALLDRGWGKPSQELQHTGDVIIQANIFRKTE